MAGLGKKTFAAGEVLRAADVNGYLMDQAVQVYAGTAARGSAIGTAVSEGMVSYLADTNAVEVYTGSAWQSPHGLTLITKSTFSGVSSVAVDNVFSSAYQNYRIVLEITVTVQADIGIRYRTGSGDDSTSNYYGRTLVWGNDGGFSGTSITAQNNGVICWGQGSTKGFYTFDIGTPNEAKRTGLIGHGQVGYGSGAHITSLLGVSMFTTTQYTGFSLNTIAGSGTYSGSITVYGYRSS